VTKDWQRPGRWTWCHAHHRDEPDLPGDYRSCGECGHVYRTEADLLAEHNDLAAEIDLTSATSGAEVYTCPLCAHDF
jgi:hypothetical protein